VRSVGLGEECQANEMGRGRAVAKDREGLRE